MRFGIITDIHEDIISLSKALKQLEKLKCDEIICLGDICGFSIPYYKYHNIRNASECVRLVRENCKYSVIGNHDLFAIKKLPKNILFFSYPDNWYELNYFEKLKIAKNKIWLYEENELIALLKHKDIEYLKSLPEFIRIESEKTSFFFSHYIFPDLTGCSRKFLFHANDLSEHHRTVKTDKKTISIFGHSHPPGIMQITNCEVITNKKRIDNFENIYGISGPCITQNQTNNGFMILDIINENLQAYFLKKSLF
jgi:predicted phosphodiesterase